MTERVRSLLELLNNKDYRATRRPAVGKYMADGRIHSNQDIETYADKLRNLTEQEEILLYNEYDRFGFHRTLDFITPGGVGNVAPNYARVIGKGFDECVRVIRESMANTTDGERLAFGRAMLSCIDSVFAFCERYRAHAEQVGGYELAEALAHIPHKGARTFYEALVFLRLIIYFIRSCFHTHMPIGRFDQYMLPYYTSDRARGVSKEDLFELLEEFFISINFDADLYAGMQTGDNGQSMVLGGFDADGRDCYNELSELCLRASLELKIIDPKINLRVGRSTRPEVYRLGTELTRAGLGYPQYCNDDVIAPGLIKLGYAPADAYNYCVAACWEAIIPHVDSGIPNLETMDFPRVVSEVITRELGPCESFEDLLKRAEEAIATECEVLIERQRSCYIREAPFLSVFLDGCCETLRDLSHGGTKYHNYGCHGAGLATATDSLAAVKELVYTEGRLTKERLLAALEADFEGYEEERNLLLSCPKMGNGDETVEGIARTLLDAFARNMNRRDNYHGGVWRAGTGSAMDYLSKGSRCPATADGRHKGAPYSSSFSPSLEARPDGLLSVIRDFTAFDLTETVNGGPLTVEIHDTALRNEMGMQKTAELVRLFVELGGHQLQLNSINRETLLDAQVHPEQYPHLIVRVWGWSGYFNELDRPYQDHVIRRVEYGTP